jgi:hypothetical protein
MKILWEKNEKRVRVYDKWFPKKETLPDVWQDLFLALLIRNIRMG